MDKITADVESNYRTDAIQWPPGLLQLNTCRMVMINKAAMRVITLPFITIPSPHWQLPPRIQPHHCMEQRAEN